MKTSLALLCLFALNCFLLGQTPKPPTAAELSKTFQETKTKAEKGDADAQVNLGHMFAEGRGVVKDEAEAVKWFRKAADQGHASGQSNLGRMYNNGWGVVKDEAEAVKWFRKAADQGDADAQTSLGLMYENGRGVAKDEVEAVKWYRKAADQGNADGQVYVGRMYWGGRGVAKDVVEAYKWFLLAAAQGVFLNGLPGVVLAKEGIGLYEGKLTPQQKAEGKRRAQEWKPQNPQKAH